MADGKSDGPTKRKVQHLKELGTADDDTGCLSQGSHHKDRIFLDVYGERQAICAVLTESTGIDDFLTEPGIESETGRMVLALIDRIFKTWGEEMPKQYKRFIANICKQTSVAGFLQVTSNLPLNYLELFCHKTLDLRSVDEIEKLDFMQKQLPAFWPMLTNLLDLEGTKYLPTDIKCIVLKLIDIRKNTFLTAAPWNDDDYWDWPSPGEEHPTQFYPDFPKFRYPKRCSWTELC